MSGRIVARTFSAAALGALLAVSGTHAALAASQAPPGATGSLVDQIQLPDGFRPEGIAIDAHGIAYFGSLANGDIYAADVRTGDGEVVSEGPDTPAAGLKVDQRGRLFVSGGTSGTARVVDVETGETLATYQLATGVTFINDVVVTRDAAWFTDSQNAALYKVPLGPAGALPAADDVELLPLTGEWEQVPDFNANGIAETPDHQALLVVQSATGLLFRVDPETGAATVVDLGGYLLANGDGLLVVGRTLYVVQNTLNLVAEIRLDAHGTTGAVVETLTNPEFDVPTTVAAYANSLYLPNARFSTPPTPDTTYEANRIDR